MAKKAERKTFARVLVVTVAFPLESEMMLSIHKPMDVYVLSHLD